MFLGNGIRLGAQLRSSGGEPFDPSVLFANDELGVWYDPSDLSTMFQDTAGTIPITAGGQTVARINDKSGNGYNATQATAGARPTYRTDGARHWLGFDGTADFLVTPTIGFNTANEDRVSFFAGVETASGASTGMLVELSTGVSTNIFNMTAPNGTGYGWRSAGSAATSDVTVSGFPAPESAVLTGFGHIGIDLSVLRRNGVQVGTNATNQFSGPYRNAPIYIGARNGASVFFEGKLFSLIVRGKVTSGEAITNTEAHIAGKTGITL